MKTIILLIILILILLIIAVWLVAFFYLNDFSVPTADINKYKKILIVFPHADDETLTASGLMRMASLQENQITWVILTKGERGNPTDTVDLKLKPIRTQEVKQVANLLGVTKVLQEDFGDGQIMDKKKDVTKFLTAVFQEEKPDLVITYDLSGWYGHPDHIATTEVVNELINTKFKTTHLWYVTLPKRVWDIAGGDLPTQMAKTPDWIKHRTYPNVKVFVGLNVIQTVQSVYMYKSQYQSFREAIPFAPIPMWFFVSMDWFNYFHVAN